MKSAQTGCFQQASMVPPNKIRVICFGFAEFSIDFLLYKKYNTIQQADFKGLFPHSQKILRPRGLAPKQTISDRLIVT